MESGGSPFTLTIDWLSFTIPACSPKEAFNRLGGEWRPCSRGYRGYPTSWIMDGESSGVGRLGTGAPRKPGEISMDLSGGIVSAWSLDKLQGVLDWTLGKQGHLTRIDCALDDRQGFVPLETIRQAMDAGQYVTRARWIDTINRKSSVTGVVQGTTLYVGSAASETRLRIYDKGLQMQTNGRQQWPKQSIRWELQLRKKRAHALGCELAKCLQDEWRRRIIGLVRAFIDFRDVMRMAPKWGRSRAEPLSWWVQLTDSFARAQLTVETPAEWGLGNITRSLKQMAPSLSVLVDLPGGRAILEAEIEAGRWRRKEKHIRVLRQYGIVLEGTTGSPRVTLQECEGPDKAEALLTGV